MSVLLGLGLGPQLPSPGACAAQPAPTTLPPPPLPLSLSPRQKGPPMTMTTTTTAAAATTPVGLTGDRDQQGFGLAGGSDGSDNRGWAEVLSPLGLNWRQADKVRRNPVFCLSPS